MKIFEVTETDNSTFLVENLGNLAQLNAGNLINLLKQRQGYSRTKTLADISHDQNKFTSTNIGSTSEIVDIGKIKTIADLRRAYRNNEGVHGFVLYIGQTAVVMGVADSYDIAGSSRPVNIAWDFTQFNDQLNASLDNINKDKNSWQRTTFEPSSSKEKQERDYTRGYDQVTREYPMVTRKYTGVTTTTSKISEIISMAASVANLVNLPLEAKVILTDKTGHKKRMDRNQIRWELGATARDLKTRLAKYKLSKKPTANNIQDFINAIFKSKLTSIQFAGSAYGISSKDAIPFDSLVRGVPFKISYRSVSPGDYGSVEITYAYANEKLLPILATYTDKTDPRNTKSVTEVLEPKLYATRILKISNPTDKDSVMQNLLPLLKDEKFRELSTRLKAIRDLGMTWPELDIIEKSMNAELEKKKTQA